ncbi:MAG TPA: glycoside hydrolase family 43 protein [Acidimicrobiales bacterium]|nr:glycoside hydrolase family 43 protein [Acidimicrobiales bacterium]
MASSPGRLRRAGAGLGAVVLVLGVAAGVADDLHLRAQLDRAQTSLAGSRSSLASTLHRLASVQTRLASSASEQQTLHVALEIVAFELSGAQSNLAHADAGLSSSDAHIGALDVCLGGVERALNQISVGDQSGAVASISGVSSSCQSAQGQGAAGPVYPFDFPDPDVVRVGTTYDAYSTNSATGAVQLIDSTDLRQWSVLGDALSTLPRWAKPGATWAPGVVALGGRYLLYYAADVRSTGQECISVATAPGPTGPFVDDSAAPLECQAALGGSIDPSPFVDSTGTPYLVWKSNGGDGHPATLWSEELSPGGTAFAGPGPTALLRPDQSWQGTVVEGPFMVLEDGTYDLFYSANDWNGPDYAIGAASCRGPTGPCTDLPGPLLASQAAFVSPGGPSLFTDTAGQVWLAFHAYLPGAVGFPHSRLLFLRPVSFAAGVPVVSSG